MYCPVRLPRLTVCVKPFVVFLKRKEQHFRWGPAYVAGGFAASGSDFEIGPCSKCTPGVGTWRIGSLAPAADGARWNEARVLHNPACNTDTCRDTQGHAPTPRHTMISHATRIESNSNTRDPHARRRTRQESTRTTRRHVATRAGTNNQLRANAAAPGRGARADAAAAAAAAAVSVQRRPARHPLARALH